MKEIRFVIRRAVLRLADPKAVDMTTKELIIFMRWVLGGFWLMMYYVVKEKSGVRFDG